MKLFFILAAMMTLPGLTAAPEVPERLLDAIARVESGGNDRAVGDKGKAVGRFQIWKIYVDETNRIAGLKKSGRQFTYDDRLSPAASREMVRIYLGYWGNRYEKDTGGKADNEVLAKIHNGHAFWKRSRQKNPEYFNNLETYWTKVKKELDSRQ